MTQPDREGEVGEIVIVDGTSWINFGGKKWKPTLPAPRAPLFRQPRLNDMQGKDRS